MKTIIFSIPNNSKFYKKLFEQIEFGFKEAGCNIVGNCGLPPSHKLLKQIDRYQPDFVFEINRSKGEIPNFPSNIPHICWLIDFWGRNHNEIYNSDILYTFIGSWKDRFTANNFKFIRYLPPGTSINTFFPSKKKAGNDFIVLGHIPKPWEESDLSRVVWKYDDKNSLLKFSEVLGFCREWICELSRRKKLLDFEMDFFNRFKVNLSDVEPTIRYDITSRSIRQIQRLDFLNLMTEVSQSIEIYGSENWLLYDKVKGFYRKYLHNPNQIRFAMNNAKGILHDQFYPHFRTFDAMASGCVVFAAKPTKMFGNDWKEIGLINDTHFIQVDTHDFNTQKISNLIHNQSRITEIAQNARQEILSGHTWTHRIESILVDVENLL